MTTGEQLSPLFTDLYELTMAAAYWERGMEDQATFSLFLRGQPQRGYYVAAGLAPALSFLEKFKFDTADIEYLKRLGLFNPAFLTYLQTLRFTGDVWALAEGSLFFPDEPVMEVTAPLVQAQLLETFLINTIGVHTLIATKAARCVHAAGGRKLMDFSLRRTQGADAGMAAARSTYLAGFDATSNVLAGKQLGIPVAGTMAHSFVQAFADEAEAFEAYARTFPEQTVLLIDTYDTLEGAKQAISTAKGLAASGKKLVGVRLDSGDVVALSLRVRQLFDEAGLDDVKIFVSGGFDEFSVARALEKGAPIDAFGLGTKVGVSADRPFLDLVYKLVRYGGRNVRKFSPGKETLGAQKQVFRFTDRNGLYKKDIIGHRREDIHGGKKLLHWVVKKGKINCELPTLEKIRVAFRENFGSLPEVYKQLDEALSYPVRISGDLMDRQ